MTLTEKWDKGELPEGDYYIKRRNGDFLYDNIDTSGVWRNSIDEDIEEVLAPVPSYNEWQQLKELLRECREELIPLWDELLFDYDYKTGNSSARLLRIDDLLNRIGNTIGEKK